MEKERGGNRHLKTCLVIWNLSSSNTANTSTIILTLSYYHTALLTPSLTMRFLSSFLAQQTVNIDLIQTIFASSYMTSFQSFPNNRNSIFQDATNFLILTYKWSFIHIYPLISPYTLVPQVPLFSIYLCS